MTVTIHFPAAPSAAAVIIRQLVDIAGGDRRAVRSGHGGATVSNEVALAYLSDATPPAPTRMVVPTRLAAVVRDAEGRGGLLQPHVDQAPEPKPQTRGPAARRPRRQQQGATP